MRDITELIKYHNECEYLDFKSEEYTKNTMHNLVKDVLAFANADMIGDRYIIIGVHKKDGQIRLFNVESKLDSSNIQQKIHTYIHPEIKIEYFSYEYESRNLMILVVKSPDKQPYMMVKDLSYKKKDGQTEVFLKANECWVRKGSYQLSANREDYIRMTSKPSNEVDFNNHLDIYFPESGCDSVKLQIEKDIDLPSDVSKRKIEGIIAKKESQSKGLVKNFGLSMGSIDFFRNTPYEERDIRTLKENLRDIKETYRQADYHYLFEERSYKLNIKVLNRADTYLEDASIELRIPRMPGLIVSDAVYTLRETRFDGLRAIIPEPPSFEEMNYPSVEVDDDFYVIREEMGNIKHHIERNVFKVDLRIVLTRSIEVSKFDLHCSILGRNNKGKIERDLHVLVDN